MSKYDARTKEGHLRTDFQGIPLVIDRPKGFVQKGTDASGVEWERTYQTDYGFIPRSRGGDGDGLDVFVGPDATSERAFWVTQHKLDGDFDEYKLFLGYPTPHAALEAFLAHIPAKFFGQMRETSTQMIKALRCREPSEPNNRIAGVVASMRLCELGPSDVHIGGDGYRAGPPTRPRKEAIAMADISTEKRNALPASSFADPVNRAYPIHDKAHSDNAAARLEQQKGSMSPAKYRQIKARIRAAQRRFGEKPTKSGAIHVRARIAAGGHLHVRHMSDRTDAITCRVYVPLGDAATTAGDGAPVWIQLAKTGHFEGHRAGAFDLDQRVFSDIIRNFRDSGVCNGEIQFDFDHASELPPDGANGAPAQGWIKNLRIQGGNLYGLVKWLEPARSYILGGKYKHVSPAIKFGEKHPVTGAPLGARLSSAALTNSPFLTGMQSVAASMSLADGSDPAREVTDVLGTVELQTLALRSSLAHQPHEYMPRIKAALKLPELSTAIECSDHLERLSEMCDLDMAGDGDGMHEGVNLSSYTLPLRDMVCGGAMGSTLEDVFDIVRTMIRSAIGEHELVDHGEPPDDDLMALDDDLGGSDDDMGGGGADLTLNNHSGTAGEDQMTDKKIQDLETEKAVLLSEKGALANEKSTLLSQNVQLTTEKAKLELSLTEAKGKVEEQAKELTTLRAEKTARDEADLVLKVNAAFDTYKDKKHLTETSKKTMLIVLKADPVGFDAEYPPISAEQRHLLSLQATNPNKRPAPAPAGGVTERKVSRLELSQQVASQRGITLGEAMLIVDDMSRVVKTA